MLTGPGESAVTNAEGRIAVVVGEDGTAVQALLAVSAAEWRAAGANAVGVVAEEHGLPDRTCSAGVLRDLASGQSFAIYLDAVPAGTSCHLDADGVDAACAAVLRQLATSDVVVLSKFGKLEAIHAGLSPAFEAALAAGKPVLTTVSARHREAWRAFAPGAVEIPAERTALQAWWRGVAKAVGTEERPRRGGTI